MRHCCQEFGGEGFSLESWRVTFDHLSRPRRPRLANIFSASVEWGLCLKAAADFDDCWDGFSQHVPSSVPRTLCRLLCWLVVWLGIDNFITRPVSSGLYFDRSLIQFASLTLSCESHWHWAVKVIDIELWSLLALKPRCTTEAMTGPSHGEKIRH